VDKRTDEPLQLPSDLITAVSASHITEAQLFQIFIRTLQQISSPQNEQPGISGHSNLANIRRESQPLQQATPEHTQTSIESDQISYSDQQQSLSGTSSSSYHSNRQSFMNVQSNSHVGVSMTSDSSYYINDLPTHQIALSHDVYRQSQPSDLSLDDSQSLDGMGWTCDMIDYDIDEFQYLGGYIPEWGHGSSE